MIISLIRELQAVGQSNEDADRFLKSISGLAFYGTPFIGSAIAGGIIGQLTKIFQSSVVADLAPWNADIEGLNRKFLEFQVERRDVRVVGFVEMKKTNGVVRI